MVLPSISPLSGRREASVDVPPPLRFKPLKGPITEVRLGAEQIVHGRISADMSFAKIAGLKYEQQFLNYLREEEPQVYIRPHIHFRDNGVYRTVIPDAVLWADDVVVVFEVKSQHMPEAWWQLEKLYIPVLEKLWFGMVRGVEVVKTYDPQMPWPGTYMVFSDLEDATKSVAHLGVLKWRKKT